MKKIFISISLLFLIFSFSGCASWNEGSNIKSQDAKFAMAISRYEFIRHHGVPVVNPVKEVSVKLPVKNKPLLFKISERKTPPLLPKILKKPILKVKMQVVSQASIVGNQSALPVITVNYTNKPLWAVLQDVSNRTGYVFSTQGINLAKTYNLTGRFNLAELLSKIFVNDNTTVNIKTKGIKIWR